MPADQPRTRTVGCKMTDSEYERLAAVAEGDGMTLGGGSGITDNLAQPALHGSEGRENHSGRDAGDHRPGGCRESEEGGRAAGSGV
jgi:hypothetical protein